MSINYYEAGIYWVLEAKGKTLGSSVWGTCGAAQSAAINASKYVVV